jgi:catechol 2,3-dioxygenase
VKTVALRGINHIVLKVRSLEASDRFYREVLGLTRVGERGRMWFYTAGAHHHDLALLEVGPDALFPRDHAAGLFHFCLDVTTETELAVLYQRCREAGIEILGSADHNIMRSFYVRDPDGNVVELGVDVPEKEWSREDDPFAFDRAYSPVKT